MDHGPIDTGGRDDPEGTVSPSASVDSARFTIRGWLEPEAAPVPGAPDTVAAFAARGQAAPFGRIRLVCVPAGPDSGRTPGSGWATVIVDPGDSLYGSVADDGVALAITVEGGTGMLDGATGWMRVGRGDGATAAGVTGEIRVPGQAHHRATSEPQGGLGTV